MEKATAYPFELPYLVLYDRVVSVHEILRGMSDTWPRRGKGAISKFRRLHSILSAVIEGEHAEEFRCIIAETKRDRKIFDRFRTALRICPKGGRGRRNDEGAPTTLSSAHHRAILERLRSALDTRAQCDEEAAKACRIVIEHIDKYWRFLFGHKVKGGPRPIVAPRTNNDEERLFREIKRQCRRLHGRGHLSRDVNEMPAGTALLQNLKNVEYCETVYNGTGPEKIAARFSEIDPRLPADLMRGWKRDRVTTRLPRKLEQSKNLPELLAHFLATASRTLSQQA